MNRPRLDRITGIEALLWAAAIAVPLVLVARAPDRRDIVDRWLAVQRTGDIAAMEAMLTGEPVLEVPPAGRYPGAAAARDALEWRRATGSALEVEREIENDDADGRLALAVTERSRALDLLGVRPTYQVYYYVRGQRIFTELALPEDRRADAALADSLAAFARWLEARDPAEGAALFDRARPVWTGRTAARWLAALEEWRAR